MEQCVAEAFPFGYRQGTATSAEGETTYPANARARRGATPNRKPKFLIRKS